VRRKTLVLISTPPSATPALKGEAFSCKTEVFFSGLWLEPRGFHLGVIYRILVPVSKSPERPSRSGGWKHEDFIDVVRARGFGLIDMNALIKGALKAIRTTATVTAAPTVTTASTSPTESL
jgi:hypothetical protein